MNEIQRRDDETVLEWLERLLEIDPERLTPRRRSVWELSVGYARYLAAQQTVQPECVVRR
jgi:hypothetical protein